MCGKVPDLVYAAFPLALRDFRGQQWDRFPLHQIVALYRGPLQGLETLHRAGYMHRDVHQRNLLIMSLEPPQAVLCDFGKSIQANYHSDPHLGPLWTQAPEIDGCTNYDKAIDIWSLAFSFCCSLFPESQEKLVNRCQRTTKQWHNATMVYLSKYSEKGKGEEDLADLLRSMLMWEPKDRISATAALQHPCMSGKERAPAQLRQGYHEPSSWNDQLDSSESVPSSSTSANDATGASMLAFHRAKRREVADRNTNSLIVEDRLLRRRN